MLEAFLQDIRYGARVLLKHKGFTVVAVLTLALGIGANTAIFSVVNELLLRPLPYHDADQIVMLWEVTSKGRGENPTSRANFRTWREQSKSFESMAAFTDQRLNLTGGGEPEEVAAQLATPELFHVLGIEPILGRYLHLDYAGRPYRIYFESAGPEGPKAGIPLLCLHTAGADGRQYRGLMNATSVTDRFRVIAFDLPWHGKSSPPEGWQDEEYRLTADFYTGIVMAFIAALSLERPVVMGCSIGGRVVLHLALRHPNAFRALIGLESSAHVDPYYDRSWLHRADVHGGKIAAGAVSGLLAPQAPSVDCWETLRH